MEDQHLNTPDGKILGISFNLWPYTGVGITKFTPRDPKLVSALFIFAVANSDPIQCDIRVFDQDIEDGELHIREDHLSTIYKNLDYDLSYELTHEDGFTVVEISICPITHNDTQTLTFHMKKAGKWGFSW